ncbi:DUF2182 domain-containing protein [Inquilinus limosus]|uniref:DUF2182 domain-containing protein n=1 Tax=Inquilinus limosus TaxID=171674 RepID=UPI003F135DEF
MRETKHDRAFIGLFSALVVLAWVTLAVWSQSPYGRYLDHGNWTRLGLVGALCEALPAGDIVLPAVLYIAGWVLMTAAMMVPTTLPFLLLFRRIATRHRRPRILLALLVAGYLLVWAGVGLTTHLLGLGLIALVRQSVWLTFNGWVIGAAVLALAGLFQFSSLKYRCLDACRTPAGFIAARWRGSRPQLESLRLGLAHGAFCAGCCWALMTVMFVVGTGSVGWMLALAAVMAIEKNMRWGHALAQPTGFALLFAAATLAIPPVGL